MELSIKTIIQLRKQGIKISGVFKDANGVYHIVVEDDESVDKLMKFSSSLPREFKVEKDVFQLHKFRLTGSVGGYYIKAVDSNGFSWLCSPNANGITNYHCIRGATKLYLMNGDTVMYKLNVINKYPLKFINYLDAAIVDHSLWWRYPGESFDVDVKAVLFAGGKHYAVLFDGANAKHNYGCIRDITCRLSTVKVGDVIYGYPWDQNAGGNIIRSLKIVSRGIAFVLDENKPRLFRDVLYAESNDSFSYPSIPGYSGSAWFADRVPDPNPA